jgi:alpha-methylacyl-CoA racemase
LRLSGLEKEKLPSQNDRPQWPALKRRVAEVIRTKTREEWCRLMEGSDVCFAPVLSLAEAPKHPHNVTRKAFIEVGGVVQPAPAPRFSRTPNAAPRPPAIPGENGTEVLGDWGFSSDEIGGLRKARAIA